MTFTVLSDSHAGNINCFAADKITEHFLNIVKYEYIFLANCSWNMVKKIVKQKETGKMTIWML